MKLSNIIQDISQGNYYSENALKSAISTNIPNALEHRALEGFLSGHHNGDIHNNIMRLQDLSIKLKNIGL